MISHAILAAAALLCAATVSSQAETQGRITGVGGIFFKSKDPAALARWYHDVLGIDVEKWGGAMLRYDAPDHPAMVVWTPFKQTTEHFAPSTREFMINFGVDNMDAFLAKLASKGVHPIGQDDSDPSGRFAWIVDPDGTKIELWQANPKKP